MRKFQALLTIATLTIAAVSTHAQADVKKLITSYYIKSDELTKTKDAKGLSKLLTDSTTKDFVSIDKPDTAGKSQIRSREVTIQTITSVIPLVEKFDKATSHIDDIVISKESIVVTVTTSVAITTKAGPDGKAHKLVDSAKSKDVWVKVGTAWKLKSSKTLTETMTENGKPVKG